MSDEEQDRPGARRAPSSDDPRSRRIADSVDLLKRIDDLAKVRNDSRIIHIHNELVFAIDRLSKERKDPFNKQQKELLKDVAFEIVFILDPQNRESRGLRRRFIYEWKQQTLLKQIGTIAAILAFLGAAAVGAFSISEDIVAMFTQLRGGVTPAKQHSPSPTIPPLWMPPAGPTK